MWGRGAAEASEITLFHVVESIPDDFAPWSGTQSPAEFQKFARDCLAHNRQAGEELLKQAHRSLEQAGVASASIHEKLLVKEALPEARRIVAALGVIEEMRQPYDVVVIGRRGSSPAAESFLGGVAEKIVREAKGKTVWVVD